MAKFQLALNAMEATHSEVNDWGLDPLASICNMVSLAHKSGKNKSQLEKDILLAWCTPNWQVMTCFDQIEEKVVLMGFTITQQHKYRKQCQ